MISEEDMNNMLNTSKCGILASTIDTIHLGKPYRNAINFAGSDWIDKEYCVEHCEQINDAHLSMNWSMIIPNKKAVLLRLKSSDSNSDQPSGQTLGGPSGRDFAYLADPTKLSDRIVHAVAKDPGSNSNFWKGVPAFGLVGDVTKGTDQLEKVYKELLKKENQECEIKTLGFKSEAFLGLLCQTKAYDEENYYNDFKNVLKELGTEKELCIPIFKYTFVNGHGSFENIANVTIKGDDVQIICTNQNKQEVKAV